MNKMKFGSSKLAIDNDLLNAFSNSKTVGYEKKESIDEINAKDLAEELLEKANHSITSTERERSALSKIAKALSNPQIVEVDVSLLDSYKDHTFNVENDDMFFRITVEGADGKRAYTNAYFIDELTDF